MNRKFKFNLYRLRSKRVLLFISCLFMIIILSSNFSSTINGVVSPFVSGSSEKIVNNWGELEAAVNSATNSTVIILNADITMKTSLIVYEDKQITLKSADTKSYKLIRDTKYENERVSSFFFAVSGVLTLDGVVLTHTKGKNCFGIYVNDGGTFIMNSGEISGNSIIGYDFNTFVGSGAGVCVYSGGSFIMYGGAIKGNTATHYGGGVYNMGSFSLFGGVISDNNAKRGGGVYNDGGVFTMSGGVITNNKASENGGGVFNFNGSFNSITGGVIDSNQAVNGGGVYNDARLFGVSGGVISNNDASEFGGGVYIKTGSLNLSGGSVIINNTAIFGGGVAHRGNTFTMFDSIISDNIATSGGGVYVNEGSNCFLNSGVVSNNRALGNGGGIWISDYSSNFNSLFVANKVVFSNNHASAAYNRNKIHDTVYNTQIKGEAWSKPLTQGYNNYDISYVYGTPISFYNVTVHNSYAELTGEDTYIFGGLVTINAGIRDGYTFSGWTVRGNGVTLSSNTTTTATFTMPTNGVVVTANWKVNYSTWIHIGIVICIIVVVLTVVGVLLQKRSKKRSRATTV